MDCTVHGILQARILEWVAIPFSRGSSQPKDKTQVSQIAGRFFTSWTTRECNINSCQCEENSSFTFWNFLELLSQIFFNIFLFWCGPFLKSLLSLLQHCLCFMFWSFGCNACGILTSWLGIKLTPSAFWKVRSYPLDHRGSPSQIFLIQGWLNSWIWNPGIEKTNCKA